MNYVRMRLPESFCTAFVALSTSLVVDSIKTLGAHRVQGGNRSWEPEDWSTIPSSVRTQDLTFIRGLSMKQYNAYLTSAADPTSVDVWQAENIYM